MSPRMQKKGAPRSPPPPQSCPDSLLPPGEQQAVIEEVQVDRLAGQLQLGRGHRGQGCQLHQLPVPNQPAGLRDQREDLGGWRKQGSGHGQRAEGRGWEGWTVMNWPAAPREEATGLPLWVPHPPS